MDKETEEKAYWMPGQISWRVRSRHQDLFPWLGFAAPGWDTITWERSRSQPSACSVFSLSVAERETMEEAVGPTYSQVPLQERVSGNGHLETGGQSDPHGKGKKCIITLGVALALVSSALIAAIVLAVLPAKPSSADLGPPAGPACPDGWVGYQSKCHYFSETEGNWTYCRSNCSSLGASLAGIDSEQERTFLLRYKGVHDHWIGLHREPGQPWKWTNGTAFNRLLPIRGGGDCAYLNDENGISSSRCSTERRWICSKPEVYVTGKETALEGNL